jgi:hypothetical protein
MCIGDCEACPAKRGLPSYFLREWLLADLSLMDVHFQLWMMLVSGILLAWFAFVWATRHVR